MRQQNMKSQELSFQNPFSKMQLNLLWPLGPMPVVETTSIDGRPFLTPDQFGALLFKDSMPLNGAQSSPSETNPSQVPDLRNMLNQLSTSQKITTTRKNEGPIVLDESDEDSSEPYKQVRLEDKATGENFVVKLEPLIESLDPEDYDFHPPERPKNAKERSIIIVEDEKGPEVIDLTEPTEQKGFRLRNRVESSKDLKVKKIMSMKHDPITNDFVFQVEAEVNRNPSTIKYCKLTRKELLESNPILLLYFYETKVKFPKDVDFSTEEMVKLKEMFNQK